MHYLTTPRRQGYGGQDVGQAEGTEIFGDFDAGSCIAKSTKMGWS